MYMNVQKNGENSVFCICLEWDMGRQFEIKFIMWKAGLPMGLLLVALSIPTCCLFSQQDSTIVAEQDTIDYVTDTHDLRKDIEPGRDINQSIPQGGYVFSSLAPKGYAELKDNLYDKTGFKFGLSYQTLYQSASESTSETSTAWGGWLLFELSWDALNRGKDYQGKLIISLDDRHIINESGNTAPAFFRLDHGSLWATDGAYLKWNLYPAVILWEQTFVKDRFEMRVGQFGALTVLDFFRFADPRTSFTNTQLGGPVALMPLSPPGLGMSFKWWPIEDSELYISGMFNDINAKAGEVDWSGLFEFGEIFTGVEIGYNDFRSRADFDHYHLTLWYGDNLSSRPYPSKSGWGFKIHGSKQLKNVVTFGNYAYNNSEGGGFNYTNTRHAVNLGVAYNRILNLQGELALAGSWAQPLDGTFRSQSGIETYWKLLLGSDLWMTPGVQLIWNPTFNTNTDFLSIIQIKSRLFL
jgi:hypothetical protein